MCLKIADGNGMICSDAGRLMCLMLFARLLPGQVCNTVATYEFEWGNGRWSVVS